MAKIKLTYTKLLDEVKPCLEMLSNLDYSDKTPISHLFDIAENLSKVEDKSKVFWEIREKLIEPFIEKDEDGKPKKETFEDGQTSFVFTDENKDLWQEKYTELRETEVEVDLKKMMKKHFEGAKELKPLYLKGIMMLLK